MSKKNPFAKMTEEQKEALAKVCADAWLKAAEKKDAPRSDAYGRKFW